MSWLNKIIQWSSYGVFFLIVGLMDVRAADISSGRTLALANESKLLMGVGHYAPGQGWLSYEGLMRPSEPGDVFTLYTMAGEVGHVVNIDPHPESSKSIPLEWAVRISTWFRNGEPYALAVLGSSPVKGDAARALSLQDPELINMVSVYLKKKKLVVPYPRLTQAFEVDLGAGGPRSILLTSHSDDTPLSDDQAAPVYALALLFQDSPKGWRISPLAEQMSYKPHSETADEHIRFNGTRDFYRFLTCLDLNDDGDKEIVLYVAQEVANMVVIFSLKKGRPKELLRTYKHLFN